MNKEYDSRLILVSETFIRRQARLTVLEAGVPEQTVMAMVGHVARRMLDRYSHTRLEAKPAALRALEIESRHDLRHDLAQNGSSLHVSR